MNEPTIEEIAALTARLRRLSDEGRDADPGKRERFLAEKDELIARISLPARDTGTETQGLSGAEGPILDAGPALTAEDAAHELAADGYPLDEARALVRGYLDDVSDHVGTAVHLWGLDSADLDAIRAGERSRTAESVEHSHAAIEALPTAGCVVFEPARDLDADALADVAVREQP